MPPKRSKATADNISINMIPSAHQDDHPINSLESTSAGDHGQKRRGRRKTVTSSSNKCDPLMTTDSITTPQQMVQQHVMMSLRLQMKILSEQQATSVVDANAATTGPMVEAESDGHLNCLTTSATTPSTTRSSKRLKTQAAAKSSDVTSQQVQLRRQRSHRSSELAEPKEDISLCITNNSTTQEVDDDERLPLHATRGRKKKQRLMDVVLPINHEAAVEETNGMDDDDDDDDDEIAAVVSVNGTKEGPIPNSTGRSRLRGHNDRDSGDAFIDDDDDDPEPDGGGRVGDRRRVSVSSSSSSSSYRGERRTKRTLEASSSSSHPPDERAATISIPIPAVATIPIPAAARIARKESGLSLQLTTSKRHEHFAAGDAYSTRHLHIIYLSIDAASISPPL